MISRKCTFAFGFYFSCNAIPQYMIVQRVSDCLHQYGKSLS
jgi:hypothetical protein